MLLGIDIGTSSCKVAVFDLHGHVLCEAFKKYPVYYPSTGYAEQNPDEWYEAVCFCIKKISETFDLKNIRAIGVDGQGWSCIPISEEGKVLHNTPIWYDTRAEKQCRTLEENIGFDTIFNLCKNPVKPSYTTPKVLWFLENHPEIYNNTFKFLQSNSYIVYKLTGVFSQDKSQGYAHFFYDVEKCCYDFSMARKMGIDINKFPDIYDCHEIVGTITKTASEQTGLCKGIPVVAGGLDAACATLGVGVINNRQVQEQGGQAGGMSICTDHPFYDKRLILSNHVIPGLWLLQGGSVAGGAAMEWFFKEFGNSFGVQNILKEIDNKSSCIAPGCEGLIFLPYLNGERSPIWDSDAKGVFYGISFSKTKAHFARAIMEGVAFSLRHNLETAKETGVNFDILYSMGGSSKSDVWMQIKADITNHPLFVPDSDNASTLGAAILAGVAVKAYDSFEDAVNKTIKVKKQYYPNKNNKEIYDYTFNKYLDIYKSLKEVMAK